MLYTSHYDILYSSFSWVKALPIYDYMCAVFQVRAWGPNIPRFSRAQDLGSWTSITQVLPRITQQTSLTTVNQALGFVLWHLVCTETAVLRVISGTSLSAPSQKGICLAAWDRSCVELRFKPAHFLLEIIWMDLERLCLNLETSKFRLSATQSCAQESQWNSSKSKLACDHTRQGLASRVPCLSRSNSISVMLRLWQASCTSCCKTAICGQKPPVLSKIHLAQEMIRKYPEKKRLLFIYCIVTLFCRSEGLTCSSSILFLTCRSWICALDVWQVFSIWNSLLLVCRRRPSSSAILLDFT